MSYTLHDDTENHIALENRHEVFGVVCFLWSPFLVQFNSDDFVFSLIDALHQGIASVDAVAYAYSCNTRNRETADQQHSCTGFNFFFLDFC